jgi:hypothetical protein
LTLISVTIALSALVASEILQRVTSRRTAVIE